MDDLDDYAYTDSSAAGEDSFVDAGSDAGLAVDVEAVLVASTLSSSQVQEEDTPESLMAFAAGLRKTFEAAPTGVVALGDNGLPVLPDSDIDDPATERDETIPAIPGGYMPDNPEQSYAYLKVQQRRKDARGIPTIEPTSHTKTEVRRIRNELLEATAGKTKSKAKKVSED